MSAQLPSTQKVAIVLKSGEKVNIKNDHPVKAPSELAPGECLVKMECSGVCHTDLHAALGDWPVKPMSPLIGGHEGVGIIVAIGEHTQNSPVKIGQRVGIKWIADSCRDCEFCRKGLEQSGLASIIHLMLFWLTNRPLLFCKIARKSKSVGIQSMGHSPSTSLVFLTPTSCQLPSLTDICFRFLMSIRLLRFPMLLRVMLLRRFYVQ